MSTETELGAAEDTEAVVTMARELGDAIADLPVYQEFAAARETVESNAELQERIEAFEEQRREFMLARQSGEATDTDMAELQRAQQELHSHPDMARFLEAKEALQAELETINQAISDPLAVDFGGEAGGCCKD